MGELGERVDLIHELRELAATEEVAHHSGERLRIDQLLRGHGVDALIEQRHAFFHETFCASQTNAALIGEQFTNSTNTAAAQVVDIVRGTFALLEAEKIL